MMWLSKTEKKSRDLSWIHLATTQQSVNIGDSNGIALQLTQTDYFKRHKSFQTVIYQVKTLLQWRHT